MRGKEWHGDIEEKDRVTLRRKDRVSYSHWGGGKIEWHRWGKIKRQEDIEGERYIEWRGDIKRVRYCRRTLRSFAFFATFWERKISYKILQCSVHTVYTSYDKKFTKNESKQSDELS